MRRTTTLVTAAVVASLVLAGCSGGDDERSGPIGPNGYALSATLDDGSVLWRDRSPESGLTDLILADDTGHALASCLGAAPLYCWDDGKAPTRMLVIAPPEAESAVLHWYGQDLPLTLGEGGDAEAPSVFALALPEYTANDQGWRLDVLDGAGAVVMSS